MGSLSVDTGVVVPGGDGTPLVADILRPSGPGRFPAVVMRTAYDRTTYASVSLQVHALRLAAAGYAVVLQDVRGRGASGGTFAPFVNEQQDGVALVHWVAEQPWCDGKVGMAGVSYNAFCQLATAVSAPEPLAAWVPGLSPLDVRTSWIREGGAFNFGFHLAWGLGAVLPGDPWSATLPARRAFARPLETARRGIEGQRELAASPAGRWFARWAAAEDPYPGDPRVPATSDVARVRAPALVVAGWFDLFGPASLALHDALAKRTGARHGLVAGPWDHTGLPLGRRSGAVDFGPEAAMDLHQVQQEWFDAYLRGAEEPAATTRIFVTGRRVWETLPSWPPETRRSEWYPTGTGGLDREPPGAATVAVELDAEDPTPAHGGRVYPWEPALRPGPWGRARLRARRDVASFDSAPLARPMTVMGEARVEVTVATEGEGTDVVAVLVDVAPDGTAVNVADGVARVAMPSDGVAVAHVEMGCVAHEFLAGHRLGLDLAPAAFPRLDLRHGGGRRRWWLGAGATRLLLEEPV